jgi:macroglobulin-like protein
MRRVLSCAVALAIAAIVPATAQADPTIAGAGTVRPGTQQFGTTLCPDPPSGPRCFDEQFWRFNGTAGDRVTINWQDTVSYSYVTTLEVYPEGTDDFSINNVNPMFDFEIGDNSKAQSVFTLPQTGMFPLRFYTDICCDFGGPYDLATTVEHAVSLFISSPARKAKIKRASTVTVAVRNPEGAPLSGLPVKLTGVWKAKNHRLGTATATAGAATFQLRLPRSTRRKTIKLRASVSGVPGYLNARSPTIKVKVRR